jgi:succinyl-CoA synthetase alpha subunit
LLLVGNTTDMATGVVIRKDQYYDSVFLMGVNSRLSDTAGVQQAAVLMGSENNKGLLADIGVHDALVDAAQPNDLIVAVIADSQQIVEQVLGDLDQVLQAMRETDPVSVWRTFEDGLAQEPHANLALISIPGEYAAREAHKAIDAGLNVFIFSSNVTIEEELALKRSASLKNLLVMGPDCGTSLIGGVGIGFANAVRQGSIGVIGASGTGLQEFTSQVHNAGFGISHAIGTGTHDVSDEIGGITTFAALDALEADGHTQVIAFISKPPGEQMLVRLLERLQKSQKPIVSCFLGGDGISTASSRLFFSSTIDEAVVQSIQAVGGNAARLELSLTPEELAWCEREQAAWTPEQEYIRGIFAGGTFCYQAQQILLDAGLDIHSNAPLDAEFLLAHPDQSYAHTLLDMGDEYYTLGKPHPMIDGSLRKMRIKAEGLDPQVAVILLDFILGYNASSDPVGELLDAIIQVKQAAQERGAHLTVIASVCGTEDDPQDLNLQTSMLREQGVIVFNSNARAALFCAQLLEGR